jgi:CheY-like chemotaxis protein
MVYGTVRSHRGFIDVSSAIGEGTTFTIYLPETGGEHVETVAEAERPVRGVGRILLVDDEETVRDVVGRMLGVLGYDVTTAPDGEDAVAMVAAAPGGFDLIILDGNMPRLPGREAARLIRNLDPSVPLLLATGYLEPGTADGLPEDGFSGTIGKPYDLNQLSRAVARYRSPGTPTSSEGASGRP